MVAALSRIGAKAIVTSSHVGPTAQSEIAMQVAAELFPIRHICGFGRDLPDGVVPLDDVFNPAPTEFYQPSVRPAAAHVAAITFDINGDGLVPVARSQSELIAGGLAVFREADIGEEAIILSTIPAASFAGIALTLMPWLLASGTLALHHGFDPAVFAEQSRAHEPCSVVLPGPALTPLAEAGLLGGYIKNILALWRAPEQLAIAVPWQHDAALVDTAPSSRRPASPRSAVIASASAKSMRWWWAPIPPPLSWHGPTPNSASASPAALKTARLSPPNCRRAASIR
ncbi:MAG TPA: hypothetical protein VLN61_01965 [Pseudolabrys sp.]|nr:hypothetical protein [Pseudolabrys sp.]